MRERLRAIGTTLSAVGLAAGMVTVAFAGGNGTVFFSDGRGMAVERAWLDTDGRLRLLLPDGGTLGVDPERVARVVLPPRPPLEGDPAPAMVAPDDLHTLIGAAARRHGLDERLVLAVVEMESAFDPAAVSPVGAVGLMQLMPATAAELHVTDALDPFENVDGGVRYLKNMLQRFDGQLDLALAAYNAGPAAVRRYGGIPPFAETRSYVREVLRLARR